MTPDRTTTESEPDPDHRPRDTAIVHGTILTMDSRRRVIEDGAIAITDGIITDIGASDSSFVRQSSRILDAGGAVVHPGFVDAHTHVAQHLGRSTIPDSWTADREHEQYLPYALGLSSEDEHASALLAFLEMASHGVTAFCDMGYRSNGAATFEAAQRVGLRGIISPLVWDRPPHPSLSSGDTTACLAAIEDGLSRYPVGTTLIHAGVGLPGRGSCSGELIKSAKRMAVDASVPFYIHALFEPDHHADTLTELLDLDVLNESTILIHMIHTDPRRIDDIAATDCSVVHCPASAMRSGQGLTQRSVFPDFVSGGVNVALGSDAGNFSDMFDIGTQMYLTAMIHKDIAQGPTSVNAKSVLEMATVNAARALRIDHLVGSIEIGKQADLVVRDISQTESHPMLDVVTNFVYTAPVARARHVLVGGRQVVRERRLCGIDETATLQKISALARRLHERTGFKPQPGWPLERISAQHVDEAES